ncbi:flavin reductase [Pseudomonas sp. 21LCFQ02]|uniref:flavin reductase n=1 Tax=Pseudomonas sp. 21LCFQ02 TaxID=2957505 RepID=UPI00209ACB06|nr:flavin reductase [Pseudomonas sp. 21LCFQ02]MCO8167509.1 flavin reductase [Pseudomonas sp. 21LCFQ02]
MTTPNASTCITSACSPVLEKVVFRDAMARLSSAVSIVTTDGPGGRAGFTASAVCSVTDSPPSLLVCLNRAASVHEVFKKNGVLCVNVLRAGHQDLSNLFGGKIQMQERFNATNWLQTSSGLPRLEDASVCFDCIVSQVTEVGTHDIMICEVTGVTIAEQANGLVYFNRQYHELAHVTEQ